MPDLPVEIWAYSMDILQEQRRTAAAVIQAHFKGFKTRIGPLHWIIRYIRKGNLVQTRAAYHAVLQSCKRMGAPTHTSSCGRMSTEIHINMSRLRDDVKSVDVCHTCPVVVTLFAERKEASRFVQLWSIRTCRRIPFQWSSNRNTVFKTESNPRGRSVSIQYSHGSNLLHL